MNQSMNQSSNQSSTIPPQLDSTIKIFAWSCMYDMDICVQVGAHPKSTNFYYFLLTPACRHTSACGDVWGVSAGFTTILRRTSLPYFFLLCQNLLQCKSRWTDLRTSTNKESRHDMSWPVFNLQFKKHLVIVIDSGVNCIKYQDSPPAPDRLQWLDCVARCASVRKRNQM